MRTRLIALTALLAGTALVAGSAAQSATTTKRYLRFTGVGLFSYSLDYGEHPDSVFNGTFSWQGTINVRAIVVYDGRGVHVPKGAMIVESSISVDNQMTQWN